MWIAETSKLPSKKQLQSNRRDKWRGLLFLNGLDMELYPFWTDADKELEKKLWSEADAYYETLKAELRARLNEMSTKDSEIYFTEIAVSKQDANVWLAESPYK